MTEGRKAQLAWWASKIREQAISYAQVSDRKNRLKLAEIAKIAKEIETDLSKEAN